MFFLQRSHNPSVVPDSLRFLSWAILELVMKLAKKIKLPSTPIGRYRFILQGINYSHQQLLSDFSQNSTVRNRHQPYADPEVMFRSPQALRQWRIQGRGPGARGPGGPAPPNFQTKRKPEGPKNLFLETASPLSKGPQDRFPPPPPLISRSGSGTIRYEFFFYIVPEDKDRRINVTIKYDTHELNTCTGIVRKTSIFESWQDFIKFLLLLYLVSPQ